MPKSSEKTHLLSSSKDDLMSSSKRLQGLKERSGASYGDHDDPDAAYIIVIDPKVPGITMDWLIDLLTRHKSDGGAGLTLELIDDENCFDSVKPNNRSSDVRKLSQLKSPCFNQIFLRVSASKERFEEMSRNSRHTIIPDDMRITDENTQEETQTITTSEKQRLILKELEKLHSLQRETLFGVRNMKLYAGQSILQACKKSGVVISYYPIHEDQKLNELKKEWIFSLKPQPIYKVRNYFGDTISFYFAFLDFYTSALILPSIIGFIDFMLGQKISEMTCLFNAIWSVVFIKRWKRRSNELAFDFGSLDHVSYEPCRPLFRGKSLGTDPVTGKPCPIYPIHKTWLKEYLISVPFMMIALFSSIQIMIYYFQIESSVVDYYKFKPVSIESMVMVNLPGIIYAIIVTMTNKYYRMIAKVLNHYENHRTQSSHDNHLIIKLILFEFCNNFSSIFYVAFFLKDIQMLKYQIAIMLIVYQAIDNLQEVLIPLISTYYSNRTIETMIKKFDLKSSVGKIIREFMMTEYDNTYFDYLELFMQFSYVFMFSAVFPLAPVLALANNLIERRTDSFKICSSHKRPHQRKASGIHSAWLKAFEVLAYVSVVSNCALIAMAELSYPGMDPNDSLQTVMILVGVEHLIFLLILLINYVIPDCPQRVRINLLRRQYNLKAITKLK